MAKWECKDCGHIGYPDVYHGDEKCEKCGSRYVFEVVNEEKLPASETEREREFYINAPQMVHEFNPEKGEGEQVNCTVDTGVVTAKTPLDAVLKFADNVLYRDIDKSGLDEMPVDDGDNYLNFSYSWLEDDDASEMSKDEIKAWENGKTKGYLRSVNFLVSELCKPTS